MKITKEDMVSGIQIASDKTFEATGLLGMNLVSFMVSEEAKDFFFRDKETIEIDLSQLHDDLCLVAAKLIVGLGDGKLLSIMLAIIITYVNILREEDDYAGLEIQ